MEVVHPRCAALDVSKKDAKACIRVQGQGRRGTSTTVTTWGSTTNEILALREYLLAEQVDCVVMESTSEYWKPFYYLLEDQLHVMLVNAKAARNVPGRKTDVSDAAWLADLGAHGLLRASFVPPEPIRVLRDLTRARTVITRERTKEIQRLEKLLEDTEMKLSAVASEIVGVSGRAMLEALIGGQRDPAVLADMAKAGMRKKIPQLTEALRGRFNDHHTFIVQLCLDRIDAHSADIARLDERIEEAIKPFRFARELLISIPGWSQVVANVFIAETGADMSVFPSRRALGVMGRGGAQLQRIRRPGQIGIHPARQPPPQSRTRYRGPVGSPQQRHLLQRPPPTHRRHSPPPAQAPEQQQTPAQLTDRPDRPGRHRTQDAHRRLPHARQWRLLPRPRSRLLHPTQPRQHQSQSHQAITGPRIPGDSPTTEPMLPNTSKQPLTSSGSPIFRETQKHPNPRRVGGLYDCSRWLKLHIERG